jgi:hypothetical protein
MKVRAGIVGGGPAGSPRPLRHQAGIAFVPVGGDRTYVEPCAAGVLEQTTVHHAPAGAGGPLTDRFAA